MTVSTRFLRLTLAALLLPLALGGCATRSHDAASLARIDAEPSVRVVVVENAHHIDAKPHAGYRVAGAVDRTWMLSPGAELRFEPTETGVRLLSSGNPLVRDAEYIALTATTPDGLFEIADVPYGVGWWWAGIEDRTYNGLIEVRRNDDGTLAVIVELPVEEYLRGVVPSEIGPTAPTEALRAQAVAARSETMTALRERVYEGPHWDICADVNCQVFAGTGRRNDVTDAAIRDTRGVVLAYGGETIPAYYASNCGGFSEHIENVWPQRDRSIPCWTGRHDGEGDGPGDLSDESVLREWVTSRPLVYCNAHEYPELPDWTRAHFRWTVEADAAELAERLAARGDAIGRVLAIEPVERGISGRLVTVRFVGEDGEVEVGPELAIRQVWDPPLRSAAFVVTPVGEEGEAPESFTLQGAGYGHGVGLCQTGAMARAIDGQDYRTILTHYYTDAEVVSLYD